jgi:uncharacterized protein (TIGR02646 family)
VIRVNRPRRPREYAPIAADERAKALSFFRDPANRRRGYAFKAYKHASVKQSLERAFNGKCAYCEAVYRDVHPVEMEHYRPKAGYVKDGRLVPEGYYWLAMEWTNLLPSCIDCNRARTQEVPGAPPRLAGKANKFPIADEKRRATRPGEERHERRLLLNPCTDRPERHLVFGEDGTVDPARDPHGKLSPKGRTSIEVYGLDRAGLVDARKEMMINLQLAMTNVERSAHDLDARPGDPTLERRLADDRRKLERFAESGHEFSLMCRQAIDRFVRSLTE